jgi:hypothetical protein
VVFSSQLEGHYCYGLNADQPDWILMVLVHLAAHGYHDHVELKVVGTAKWFGFCEVYRLRSRCQQSIQPKRATRPQCLLTDASCAVTPGKLLPHAGNLSTGCLSVSHHSVPSDDCIPDKQRVSVCVRYLFRDCRSTRSLIRG